MSKTALDREWDRAAEGWVDFVRTKKDYSREYMNSPAMFRMLGSVRGKKMLDLGCGEGYNSRILARRGARVTGVDFSRALIESARRQEKARPLGIEYHVRDAADLRVFKSGSFDVVASFMALQDIENYRKAIKESARVLKKTGRLVFSVPHPCFIRRTLDGKQIGGWEFKKGTKTRSSRNALHFKTDRYFDTGSDKIVWDMARLNIRFKTTGFHWTITDFVDALHAAGMAVARIDEPQPSREGLRKYRIYFEKTLRIPDTLVVEAVKLTGHSRG
ncbi:MAG: methyltransferase domain-containing protein [Planctomycetota bacterium]|nr:methyltransferase domain-containing protein [Planctomycetota bacterium]